METLPSLAVAFVDGLRKLLAAGEPVEPVTDPMSKASNFGQSTRPSCELRGYGFGVRDPSSCLFVTEDLPVNVAYCFGLLAWSLRGSSAWRELEYYRHGGDELSDDGYSLSGAFGQRLFGLARGADQLAAIVRRLRRDPASRRTFASVLRADDNFRDSREYPCAIGQQFFLRQGTLHATTYMRAQQALTVLPYDAFLFMCIHLIISALLDADLGEYQHISGTFHIYNGERDLARRLVDTAQITSIAVPAVDPHEVSALLEALPEAESGLRSAVSTGNMDTIFRLAEEAGAGGFLGLAKWVLASTAAYRLQNEGALGSPPEIVTPDMQRLIDTSMRR